MDAGGDGLIYVQSAGRGAAGAKITKERCHRALSSPNGMLVAWYARYNVSSFGTGGCRARA